MFVYSWGIVCTAVLVAAWLTVTCLFILGAVRITALIVRQTDPESHYRMA